jgi:hypothetical protein
MNWQWELFNSQIVRHGYTLGKALFKSNPWTLCIQITWSSFSIEQFVKYPTLKLWDYNFLMKKKLRNEH